MTIRHVVLFRLNDGVSPDHPDVQAAAAASTALSATVPGGADWRLGRDLSGRQVAAHFGGVGDFESAESLAAFLTHPEHLVAASLWARVATWSVCDLDWPERAHVRHGHLAPSSPEGEPSPPRG